MGMNRYEFKQYIINNICKLNNSIEIHISNIDFVLNTISEHVNNYSLKIQNIPNSYNLEIELLNIQNQDYMTYDDYEELPNYIMG